MKLLFWLAFIVIVILALKKKGRTYQQNLQQQGEQADQQTDQPGPGQQAGAAEAMVCCHHCQVYFPASEAVFKNKQTYCCQNHADSNQS